MWSENSSAKTQVRSYNSWKPKLPGLKFMSMSASVAVSCCGAKILVSAGAVRLQADRGVVEDGQRASESSRLKSRNTCPLVIAPAALQPSGKGVLILRLDSCPERGHAEQRPTAWDRLGEASSDGSTRPPSHPPILSPKAQP